jgi:ATP-dependent exoDNAse (exonuclease V) beta subunit
MRGSDPVALHWQERLRADGSLALLLAPAGGGECGLATYLQHVEQQREHAERARLLYVATTRARERLHLVGRIGSRQDVPPPGTMLALMWSDVADEITQALDEAPAAPARVFVNLALTRFAGGFEAQKVPEPPFPVGPPAPRPEYEWAGYAAVQIGTVVHAYLQRWASTAEQGRGAMNVEHDGLRIRRELELLGVAPRDLDRSRARVIDALERVLADPRGRWILDAHEQAASELRLTLVTGGRLEHLRLDRSFVEHGTRWIIDYKTSSHEGGDIERFMDAEVERYRPQLERYANAMALIDTRPIRLGLYFPLLSAFREWERAEPAAATTLDLPPRL